MLADATVSDCAIVVCFHANICPPGVFFLGSVDATKSPRIGRLINHSRTDYNLKTKLFVVDNVPHLGLVACRVCHQNLCDNAKNTCGSNFVFDEKSSPPTQDIAAGEELSYDYGERDPSALRAMPWLKQ